MKVDAGWDNAYYDDFTAGGGRGTRPVVVSYATDPAAAVDFATTKPTTSPVAVVPGTCFATTEFAGVLAKAKHPDAARALVDYLIGAEVQRDIPSNLYVYPVRKGVPLPASFVRYAPQPADPLTLDAAVIGANRDTWTRSWQSLVGG